MGEWLIRDTKRERELKNFGKKEEMQVDQEKGYTISGECGRAILDGQKAAVAEKTTKSNKVCKN